MAKYLILPYSDRLAMTAVKATTADPADGDWSNPGNNIVNFGSAVEAIRCRLNGSDIHVVTQESNGDVRYHVFDPGTDAWTTTNELIASTADSFFSAAPTAGRSDCDISFRSDGDKIVVFVYGDGTNDQLRVYRDEGSGWTDTGEFGRDSDDNFGCSLSEPASDDRIHCIYSPSILSVYQHSTISSTNTVTRSNNITGSGRRNYDNHRVVLKDSSDNFYAGGIDFSPTKIEEYDFDNAASPTFNVTQFASDNSVSSINGENTYCMVAVGDDRHLFYVNTSDGDIYHDVNTGSGWGTDTAEKTGITATVISANYLPTDGDIGVVYHNSDTGDIEYFEFAVAAAAPSSLVYGRPPMKIHLIR